MSLKNCLNSLVLVLCAMFFSPDVFARHDCTEFSKQVSVDDGVTWHDANSGAEAVSQIVGGSVMFRFVITNCNEEFQRYDNRIDDPRLMISNALVGDGFIDSLEQVIVTKDDPGFANLDQPNWCAVEGFRGNIANLTSTVFNVIPRYHNFRDVAVVDCVRAPQVNLGDRVWEDLNANGLQDVGEPGIPGLPVHLLAGDCATPLGQTATTDLDGFYLFPDLMAGDYCVEFTRPDDGFCDTDGFNLGSPQFTSQYQGDEASDSNADSMTGITDSITLTLFDDLTIDAGIVCPAKLGDRVFLDDGNGIQDGGEPGIEGIDVNLFACGPDGMAGTADDIDMMQSRTTDANGLYMFGGEPGVYDLSPGNYYVQFEQPNGLEFTLPKQGGDDAIDSDCLAPSGRTACTSDLGSRGINLNRDCGLVAPPVLCDLTLNKTCLIPAPPPPSAGKCDGKLQQFTVIWTGDTINVSGTSNDAPGGVVNNGQAVTFSGPFSVNDVLVDIAGSIDGYSKFHVSCSDNDFNTPDNCGAVAGDGKGDANAINAWLLEGWTDKNGDVLSCSAGGDPGNGFPTLEACETSPTVASCETIGKPKSLSLQYTGGTCPGSNSQGDKAKCEDKAALSDTIQVVVTGKDANKFMFSPDAFVTKGSADDSFTLSRTDGKDLKAGTKLELRDNSGNVLQKLDIHTSCSAMLTVGDGFGGLTVTGLNGNNGGFDVVYGYTVTNNGDALTGIHVTDIPLGAIGGPFDLANGQTAQFTTMATLMGTTTNVGTASGFLANGAACVASDSVTVEVVEPPVPPTPPGSCADGKPQTLVFEYTGENCAASSNGQGDKAKCSGSLNGEQPVSIMYTGKDGNKIGITPSDGSIDIGQLLTLDSFGKNRLEANSKLEIKQGGTLLQKLEIHTSCSKPIAEGDQYGSLILRQFIPE